MEVRLTPIDKIIPYGRNPRKNEGAVEKVAASLREFGWRQPIVVDEGMTVIAGHTRLLAARRLGMAKVPVHVAAGLTTAQVQAYRLADNRTAEEADWDPGLLKLELADLNATGFNLELTAFDLSELREVMLPGEIGKAKSTEGQLDDALSYQIVVECDGEDQQAELMEELRSRGVKAKPMIL